MTELVRFHAAQAAAVAAWAQSAAEADRWASLTRHPVDPVVFARWHADAGVRAFVLLEGGRAVAYGEIWEDRDAGEAELARLLVSPAERGRGVGARLTRLLADEARRAGLGAVWVRVVADNAAALRAYANAGFARATPAEEASFNAGQPREYVWLRRTRDAAPR